MAKDAKQVNEAQFLKSMNKNKQAASVAAKSKRPVGIVDDAAIMERLGITDPGDSLVISGRVSKIQLGYAKNDTDRPYFRFAYSLSEDSPHTGKGRGTIVSNYHELTAAGGDGWERTEEQAYERMFWEFQALGEDTDSWKDPNGEALKASKRHTADKTEVTLSLRVSDKGKLQINPSVEAPADDSDLEDEDADDVEETEDEEESEDTDEEASYEEWVGGWVTWTDDEGSVDICITDYDAEENTFNGTDDEGSEYEGAPVDQCEWCDDQRDE